MSGYEYQKEQLLLAKSTLAKDMQFTFHPVTGKNIVLLEDDLYARRIDPDNIKEDAVVYGSQPIPNGGRCIFEVAITDYSNKWNGSILVGVMRQPTGTDFNQSYECVPERSEYGENHCMWRGGEVWNRFSDDLIVTRYGSINLWDIQQGECSEESR